MLIASALLSVAAPVFAQHPAFRLKGRVTNDHGEPIPNAAVKVEAIYGYAAGTFAGQRLFTATSNAKGEWNVTPLQPGIWIFEVKARGYLPEVVVLPIRILTTVSQGTSGMSLIWDLVLKPLRTPDDPWGDFLTDVMTVAESGTPEDVRSALRRMPDDAGADYLAAGGRLALVVRDLPLAQALFQRALERDPASYRAALGLASVFVLNRDFDSASRAFDATRNRTPDKNEQKFLSAAIGDLATIKVR